MKKIQMRSFLAIIILSWLLMPIGFTQDFPLKQIDQTMDQPKLQGKIEPMYQPLVQPTLQPNASPLHWPALQPKRYPIGFLVNSTGSQSSLDFSTAQQITLDHLLDFREANYPGSGVCIKNPIEITLDRGQDLVIRVDKVNSVDFAPYFSWNPQPEKFAQLLIQSKDYFIAPLVLEGDISKLGTQFPSPQPDAGYIPNFEGETVELCWKNNFTGEAQIHDLHWEFSYCIKGKSDPTKPFSGTDVNVQPVIIHLK